jgi:hypothetical protein
MKRGLITWDQTELLPAVFEQRLAVVRKELAKKDLSALVVYTDVWRSNQGRYLSNFMPYWNRALLVIPRDSAPILLCGLSPRVYPWIKSVTVLEDIRPSPNFSNLSKIREENGWDRVGVLDLPLLPYDMTITNATNVPWNAIHPEPDGAELAMYRRAAKMARQILAEELPHFSVGSLELKLRRAGAEDVVILVNKGSVSLAMEYRGHWAKITRPLPAGAGDLVAGGFSKTELLTGPYPWQCCQRADLAPGAIFAVTEGNTGDTYRMGPGGPELL